MDGVSGFQNLQKPESLGISDSPRTFKISRLRNLGFQAARVSASRDLGVSGRWSPEPPELQYLETFQHPINSNISGSQIPEIASLQSLSVSGSQSLKMPSRGFSES